MLAQADFSSPRTMALLPIDPERRGVHKKRDSVIHEMHCRGELLTHVFITQHIVNSATLHLNRTKILRLPAVGRGDRAYYHDP
jgi:hypothetical protein